MQTFIALSGNLTRAFIEPPDADPIPVVAMTFDVLNGDAVEIVVEEAALLPWLRGALEVLKEDGTEKPDDENTYAEGDGIVHDDENTTCPEGHGQVEHDAIIFAIDNDGDQG